MRFVFNFELGQWNFECHQPHTKSNCKNIFQVIISTSNTSTTKSTYRCRTSRLSFTKYEHLKHVSWLIFEKKTIWMVPVMFIKIWHDTCLYTIFQRQIDLKRSQPDTGWSRCSRTPSATLTSSTLTSTASTIYVHQKIDRHIFIYYFSNRSRFKMVPAWYRVNKKLSDTPSDTRQSQWWELQQVPVMFII